MFDYVTNRFKEASTLRGAVILLFGLCGYSLSEVDAVQLVAAGQIIAGLLGTVLPDRHG